MPGFIDLQVNGINDDDLATADLDGFRRVGARLRAAGVTAWCPTLISAPLDRYDDFLRRVAAARSDAAAHGLPTILGAHLEGPFLSVAGAHRRDCLVPADVAWMEELVDAHPDVVRIVTLAPERDPELAVTRMLTARGVTVSIGHSAATPDQVYEAAAAGATMATHVFNAMSGLHHRSVGTAGAVLDDSRITPTIIADGVHVEATAVRIAFAASDRIGVVSDTVAVLSPTEHNRGAARTSDGTLAGATTLLDEALRNLVSYGVGFARAVESCTRVPAALVAESNRGVVSVGARADLVALDPGDLAVRAVWIDGTLRTVAAN